MPPSPPSDADAPSITTPLPGAADWRTPLVEPAPSPSLERLFRRRTGLVPPLVPYVAPHAWGYRPFLFLMNPTLQAIDEQLCSQICFVVARANACRFCYGSFRTFLQVAGYSDATLDRLEHDLHLGADAQADPGALHFAVELSQGRFGEGTTVATLREQGYEDRAIREIAGIAVLAALINRVATMLAVPLNEDVEALTSEWYFGALRPVLRLLLKGWQRTRPPVAPPLARGDADGPLAPWTRRLAGTNVGHLLHALSTRWVREDSALPLRTKLLVLAVVARGLHCEELERRAARLLVARCGVDRPDVDDTVAHLRGDAIGDREVAILHLARDSIRYEASAIQATARERTRALSRSATIDAVATVGLCNALARLRALAPLDA
jgi:alkylhydroperoxidase family enzyme